MVAVLSRPEAAAAETGLHLTPAAGPGHPFTVLLAGETAHRITPPDVLGVDDGGEDEHHDDGRAGERDRGDDVVTEGPVGRMSLFSRHHEFHDVMGNGAFLDEHPCCYCCGFQGVSSFLQCRIRWWVG